MKELFLIIRNSKDDFKINRTHFELKAISFARC